MDLIIKILNCTVETNIKLNWKERKKKLVLSLVNMYYGVKYSKDNTIDQFKCHGIFHYLNLSNGFTYDLLIIMDLFVFLINCHNRINLLSIFIQIKFI